MNVEPACLNCGTVFDKPPKTQRKCTVCGQTTYVREGKLYSADVVEEWKWYKYLQSTYGITDEEFKDARTELSQQSGFKAPVRDTFWRILNDLQLSVAQYQFNTQMINSIGGLRGNKQVAAYTLRKWLYVDMARFVREEGKDDSGPRERANSLQAELFEQEVSRLIQQFGTPLALGLSYMGSGEYSCEFCREAAQYTYDPASIIVVPLGCTSERGCQCYIHVVDYKPGEEQLDSASTQASDPKVVDADKNEKRAWWKFWQ